MAMSATVRPGPVTVSHKPSRLFVEHFLLLGAQAGIKGFACLSATFGLCIHLGLALFAQGFHAVDALGGG